MSQNYYAPDRYTRSKLSTQKTTDFYLPPKWQLKYTNGIRIQKTSGSRLKVTYKKSVITWQTTGKVHVLVTTIDY